MVAVGAAFTGYVDQGGEHYADKAFKRAFVTFAVARGLNGVISVAQGTEVAVEPGGVGVNFGVGQILDPVNDLVERFSTVMLVATSSLGLQKFLLTMGSWWGVSVFLTLTGLLSLLSLWRSGLFSEKFKAVALRLFVMTLFVRFAIPLVVMGSNLVFDTFLANEQSAAVAALQATSAEIEQFAEQPQPEADPDLGFMERMSQKIDQTIESMNVGERLQRFKDSVSGASEHVVNLIVIFVLQTILLPLAFVWILLELLKSLIGGRSPRGQ